jgi:hypothetical protein
MIAKDQVKVRGRCAKSIIIVGVTAIFLFILGQQVRVLAFIVCAALDGAYIVLVRKTGFNGVICCC